MTPAMMSLWPQMYFVALWTTMSAPSVSGFWKCGERKVLSTVSRAPFSWASAARARISLTSIIGFDGVSMKIIFVSWRIFAAVASRSAVLT